VLCLQGLADWLPIRNVNTLVPQIRTVEVQVGGVGRVGWAGCITLVVNCLRALGRVPQIRTVEVQVGG